MPGQIVAGVVVVVLGLLLIGYAFGRGSIRLYAERRPFLGKVRPGPAGAFPLGMAFAAGWTPCIGPILGGIIIIAAGGSAAWGPSCWCATRWGSASPSSRSALGRNGSQVRRSG